MAKVEPPTSRSVATSMGLRPQRSPKWPKNSPPKGARQKTDGEGGKGSQATHRGIILRKEQWPEHQSRRRAIKKEIVPFQGRANRRRQHDVTQATIGHIRLSPGA